MNKILIIIFIINITIINAQTTKTIKQTQFQELCQSQFHEEFYHEILVKPPFYIDDVLNKLTDDLVIQKENFRDDYDTLKFYLEKRYFYRMSDKMFLKVFKTLWKFVFMKDENQQCIENRDINLKCIRVMLSSRKDLLFKEIKSDESYSDFSPSQDKCELLVDLFINIPDLYNQFSALLKDTFETILLDLPARKNVLSWYIYNDFYKYYNWLINDEEISWEKEFSRSTVEILKKYFLDNGMEVEWIDYSIKHFSKSFSFDSADIRFNLIVSPILDKINKAQLDKLLNVINDNNQIYARRRSWYDNTQIVNAVSQRLHLDEIYFSKYENFRYNKTVNEDDF